MSFAPCYCVGSFHKNDCPYADPYRQPGVNEPGGNQTFKKEIKMTRQQAHELVFGKCKSWEGKECDLFIKGLEALGLIKFDEEEKQMKCEDIGGKMWIVKVDSAIQTLRSLGYSVEKLPLNGR